MDVTWHGHSTWTVEQGDTTLLIDPFFDNPKTDLDPSTVETPDYLVLTHSHADHIADVGAFSDATVVATPELAGFVEEEFGVEDTVGMNIGGTFEAGDVFLTMHRADHTNGTNTTYEYDVGMPVGVLVSTERPGRDGSGTSFYHAGDTGLMSEMKDVIGPFLQPSAVAVPIGDHFTMGPWQAAIAVDWMDADHAFPIHYDTFPPVEQDPEDFASEVADTDSDASVHVLDGDERFEI